VLIGILVAVYVP